MRERSGSSSETTEQVKKTLEKEEQEAELGVLLRLSNSDIKKQHNKKKPGYKERLNARVNSRVRSFSEDKSVVKITLARHAYFHYAHIH